LPSILTVPSIRFPQIGQLAERNSILIAMTTR
jgi:hypothetical protein